MIALPPLASWEMPSQPATPTATLAIVDAPAELNALPVGVRIAGAVVAAVDGTIVLKTEFGTIMARNVGVSGVSLQKDALVSLLVQAVAPGMVLRIIEVGPPQGEQVPSAPMQGRAAGGGRGLTGGETAATPAVAVAKPAAAAGVQIEAIVLRPLMGATFTPAAGSAETADGGPTSAAHPAFAADTRLTLRMLASGAGADPAHHPTGAPGEGSSSRPSGAA